MTVPAPQPVNWIGPQPEQGQRCKLWRDGEEFMGRVATPDEHEQAVLWEISEAMDDLARAISRKQERASIRYRLRCLHAELKGIG